MSVSIVFARGVVAELQNRGLDGREALRQSGIDPARLDDIRQSLQPDESERLAFHAVAITNDPALALAIGSSDADGTFQLFGHLLRAQATVREAFATHLRYASLVARGPTWCLAERGDLAYYSITPALRASDYRRFMMEYAITASMRLCRTFFARKVSPQTSLHSVHFQHAAPAHVAEYGRFFRCPVVFGQSTNAIIFPRELLDRRQVHADATMSGILREAAERLLREQTGEESLHQRVRLLLRYTVDLQDVTASHIARCFGFTLRTLRRRLANEGHSLSELIDEARCRVACDALLREDANLPEVAELVGFSEPSAFFRAFKRWTGQTPSEFRRVSARSAMDGAEAASR